MKKRTFTAVTIVLLYTLCLSFNSCQEEEPFNPEQKIKRMYHLIENEKYLTQEWTWENDKLVKIDFCSNDYIQGTEYYFYEKNKLVKVEDWYYSFQIFYTDSKYHRIECYIKESNLLISTWDFSYKNNKVSEIVHTFEINFDINKIPIGKFLSSIISEEIISTIENSTKGENIYPIVNILKFKYNGDNVKEVRIEYVNNYGDVSVTTYKYNSYDKMLNPFYKHVNLRYNYYPAPIEITSKNNFLEVSYEHTDESVKKMNKYSYKYDNNYPIEVETKYFLNTGNGYIDEGTSIMYYEYE